MWVEMTITRTVNGREVESKASLSAEGWQQWGETVDRLGETVDFVEAVQQAFYEHAPDLCADERDEEPEEETDDEECDA